MATLSFPLYGTRSSQSIGCTPKHKLGRGLMRHRNASVSRKELVRASRGRHTISCALHKGMSLTQVVGEQGNPEMVLLMGQISLACKVISSKIARAGIEDLYGYSEAAGGSINASGEAQKKLDVVS
eukprot:3540488-Pyramimonas_sp.AAC.1